MSKRKKIAWIALFLIIIVAPSVTYFFLEQYVDTTNYENRNTASKPIFTLENYKDYPSEFENYYNDNIPYRNLLIGLNNTIDYYLFHQSSSDQVLIGKDGWLFYCNSEDGNPVEQSLGYRSFSDEQLRKIADTLMDSKRVLESRGIEFVLFIAPNKETIYEEKLPDYYERKKAETNTDQLIEYLRENTDLRIVYPKEALLREKQENPGVFLYQKLDSHWSNAGGYVGAVCLAEELGVDMPSLEQIALETVPLSTGDLAQMLNISVKDGNIDYNLSGFSNQPVQQEKWDFATEFIYHTSGMDSRNLFVKRDSFSTALAPYIASRFENSCFMHKDCYNQQQIFDYDADIFVLETAERYIDDLGDFRISYINSDIAVADGKKNIRIASAIQNAEPQYVSISKKDAATNNTIRIQSAEPLTEDVCVIVPENESGEITVCVFQDRGEKEVLDEIKIFY